MSIESEKLVAEKPRSAEGLSGSTPAGPVLAPPAENQPREAFKIGTFQALGVRDYRLLWVSNLFGSAGMWIQMVTLGWLAYDMTGSGTILGAMNGMRAIPVLLLAPLAGVAVDRLNRRTLMIGLQLVLIPIIMTLSIGLFFDQVEIWHLFVFTLVAGTVQVFYMPLQQTIAFDLVPRKLIPNAVALNSIAFNVTRVVGPSAAGYLIAWLGPEGNFFVQACAYLGVLISIFMISFPPKQASAQRQSISRNLAEGFAYVRKDKTARLLLMLGFIPPLLLIPSFISLMPIFAKDVFHAGPKELGLLMSVTGAGGLVGGVFTASLGSFERRGLLELLMLLAASLALLGFAFAPSMLAAMPLLFVAGFCEMVYMTTNQTILQLSIPDSVRGRITSLFMLSMGVMPVASLVFGMATDHIGAQAVVKIASVAALAAGMLIIAFVPFIRNLRLSQIGPAPQSGRPLAESSRRAG